MDLPRRKCVNEQAFLDSALAAIHDLGVETSFQKGRTLDGVVPCSGEYGGGLLRVAVGHADWFEIFLHEFCHLCQDVDGTPWFTERPVVRAWDQFFNWLDGGPPGTNLEAAVRHIQRCELDCERRVLRLVHKWGFTSVSPRDYATGANAYVWSYEAMRLLRTWAAPGRGVYRSRRIRRLCTSRLIRSNQIHRLPDGFVLAFAQDCAPRT